MGTANVEALLDATLDDLKDLPEFKSWPSGGYRARVDELGMKEINNHPAFTIRFKLMEVLELSDSAGAAPPEPNSTTDIAFMLDNEIGQGKLKLTLAAFAQKFGVKSLREIIAAGKGAEVIVVLKTTFNKEKERDFSNIVSMEVV